MKRSLQGFLRPVSLVLWILLSVHPGFAGGEPQRPNQNDIGECNTCENPTWGSLENLKSELRKLKLLGSDKTHGTLDLYIHENLKKWRPGAPIPAFEYRDSEGIQTQVNFKLDTQGKLYLHFPNRVLGSGSFKVVEEVFSYPEWEPLALVRLSDIIPSSGSSYGNSFRSKKSITRASSFNNSSNNTSVNSSSRAESVVNGLEKEIRVLKKIASLPPAQQVGLVDTRVVENQLVIQKRYDMDLEDFLKKIKNSSSIDPISVPSWEERISIVDQLTKGMMNLHEQGVSHSDIKAENVLLKIHSQAKPGSRLEAVYADYGLASFPQERIVNGEKPICGGTANFAPPEILRCQDWTGKTLEEKVQNSFKADVFTHATLANQILKLKPAKWLNQCSRKKTFIEYDQCREEVIQEIVKAYSDSEDYDSWQELFLRSIDHDLVKRLSDQQFAAGINYIKGQSTRRGDFRGMSESELSKKFQAMGYRSQANPRDLKQEGSYYLSPYPTSGKHFILGLHYKGIGGRIYSKKLDLDPADPEKIKAELDFLQGIGVLTRPVVGNNSVD